jgi:hypothetical protein
MLKDVKANFAQLDPASQRKNMSKALKQLMGSEPLRSPPGKPVRRGNCSRVVGCACCPADVAADVVQRKHFNVADAADEMMEQVVNSDLPDEEKNMLLGVVSAEDANATPQKVCSCVHWL